MAKQPMISTAHELYRAAVGMHDMTRLAAPYVRPIGETQPAIYLGYYFNLGFAIELYLKAYLRDSTGEDVSKYGHKLDALLEAAIQNGFNFQPNAIANIVSIIGSEHRDLKFRYAEGSTTFSYINQLHLVEEALSACRDGMEYLR